MYPVVELVTGALFVGALPAVRRDAARVRAHRVRLRDDRALRHRPPASHPAQRHHRARHADRLRAEPVPAARAGGSRSSACVLGGGVLFAIGEAYYRLRGIDGLGMGDVKMLAMIGAFLGWRLMLVTLIFASFTGALAGAARAGDRPRRHEGGAAVRHVPRGRRRSWRRWPATRSSPGTSRSIDDAVQRRSRSGSRRWRVIVAMMLIFAVLRLSSAAKGARRRLRESGSETAVAVGGAAGRGVEAQGAGARDEHPRHRVGAAERPDRREPGRRPAGGGPRRPRRDPEPRRPPAARARPGT